MTTKMTRDCSQMSDCRRTCGSYGDRRRTLAAGGKSNKIIGQMRVVYGKGRQLPIYMPYTIIQHLHHDTFDTMKVTSSLSLRRMKDI